MVYCGEKDHFTSSFWNQSSVWDDASTFRTVQQSSCCFSVLFPHVMSRVFVRSVPPRAGVAAIREWGGEDRPGGKPQEANWRQTNVINQMFAPHTKGQWLWGRGLLEGEENPSVQIREQLSGRHMKGHERVGLSSDRERTASRSSGYTFHFFTTWAARSHSDRKLAAENQTYDLFAESPSLPYISVGYKYRNPSFVVWVNIQLNLCQYIKDKLKLFIMFQNNHVTKCTCTLKSVKLNVSSPLCHKILSHFSP